MSYVFIFASGVLLGAALQADLQEGWRFAAVIGVAITGALAFASVLEGI